MSGGKPFQLPKHLGLWLLLVSSLVFLAIIFKITPSRIERTDLAFQERDHILYYRDRPFSGVTVERFVNDVIYRETTYVEGVREGIAQEYALTGSLRARWRYHADKKHGFQEGWYIEGPKRFESNFKNGVLDGEQTEWHMNGQLFRPQVFVDGVETDKKILFQSAEVFSNYTKRNGRTYGLDGGALCLETKREGEK